VIKKKLASTLAIQKGRPAKNLKKGKELPESDEGGGEKKRLRKDCGRRPLLQREFLKQKEWRKK